MTIIRTFFAAMIAAALLACAVGELRANGPFIHAPGKGLIHIYGGAGRTSSYYNTNGTIKPFDSLKTVFSAAVFGVNFDYGIMEGLELNADIPIGYFSLTSEKKFPDRSIFSPVYVGLGATYRLTEGTFSSTVGAMVKIPPGFHNGIYDDPDHPTFLSDGYMQATASLNLGYAGEQSWVKGSVGYNWRDEEPLDEIVYQAEVGITRVEGTGVFLGAQGVVSTGDVTQPVRPFYAGASGRSEEIGQLDGGRGRFSTIDRESYFAITAGAFVFISDHVMLDGRYTVRLFGANALNLQGAYLGVGYRL